jgi:hypothetical protein
MMELPCLFVIQYIRRDFFISTFCTVYDILQGHKNYSVFLLKQFICTITFLNFPNYALLDSFQGQIGSIALFLLSLIVPTE